MSSIFSYCEKETDKSIMVFNLVTLGLSLIIIPLLSISFAFSFVSINSIFKCAEVQITEKINQLRIVDITLIRVCFSLYMLMIVVNSILMCIHLRHKISKCCKKQKEKKELAQLGFTEENCQAELKTY